MPRKVKLDLLPSPTPSLSTSIFFAAPPSPPFHTRSAPRNSIEAEHWLTLPNSLCWSFSFGSSIASPQNPFLIVSSTFLASSETNPIARFICSVKNRALLSYFLVQFAPLLRESDWAIRELANSLAWFEGIQSSLLTWSHLSCLSALCSISSFTWSFINRILEWMWRSDK